MKIVYHYTPDGLLDKFVKCKHCGSDMVYYSCVGHMSPEQMLAASLWPDFDAKGNLIGCERIQMPCGHSKEIVFDPSNPTHFGKKILKRIDQDKLLKATKEIGVFIRVEE